MNIIFTPTEAAMARINAAADEGDEALAAEMQKTLGRMIESGKYALRPEQTVEDRLVRIEDKLEGLRKFTFARMARGKR